MKIFRDQTGKEIKIPRVPTRIVSLVPSQTELLYDLGLDEQVIGITKFCVHPTSWFHGKTRVGGTKALNIDHIRKLGPELVIANKEENVKEQVEEIDSFCPVWTSDIHNIEEALRMIGDIGEITGKLERADEIVGEIKSKFRVLKSKILGRKIKVIYLIWQKPLMAAGGDTFINAMIDVCGFENIIASKNRYPEISVEEIRRSGCELLLLSSEPFPFAEKHIPAFSRHFPNMKIVIVDGEMFSWYGSRLLLAADYFAELRTRLYAKGSV